MFWEIIIALLIFFIGLAAGYWAGQAEASKFYVDILQNMLKIREKK